MSNTEARFNSNNAGDPAFAASCASAAHTVRDNLDNTEWTISLENTGGGILCIVAHHTSFDDSGEQDVYFGTGDNLWEWGTQEEYGAAGTTPDGRLTMHRTPKWDAHPSEVGRAIAFTLNFWKF